MNARKKIRSSFHMGVGLLAFTWLLGTTALASPIPLPEWAKPLEPFLPKVPPEVISEVKRIRWIQSDHSEDGQRPEIKAQNERFERIVELREQGDQALIWVYLQDTAEPYTYVDWLSRAGCDRDLAAWLLPVVRFRIEWFKKALHAPGQKTYLEATDREIRDIEQYLFYQGEFSDIENLNAFTDEAKKLGINLGYATSGQRRLQDQVRDMQNTRKRIEQYSDAPLWHGDARILIEQGLLTADALNPQPAAQTPGAGSYSPKPLGPREPISELPDPDAQCIKLWMLWAGWGIVSAALLCWLFRKSKSASKPIST
jgi:hypothetical protein